MVVFVCFSFFAILFVCFDIFLGGMRTHEVGLLGRQEAPGSSWERGNNRIHDMEKKHSVEKKNTCQNTKEESNLSTEWYISKII